MPSRHPSQRHELAVMRPLTHSLEADIRDYAMLQNFPILPRPLCSKPSQPSETSSYKLLLASLEAMNPNVRKNLLNAMSTVRPSHLLDQDLRQSCGHDPINGEPKSTSSDTFGLEDDDTEEFLYDSSEAARQKQ